MSAYNIFENNIFYLIRLSRSYSYFSVISFVFRIFYNFFSKQKQYNLKTKKLIEKTTIIAICRRVRMFTEPFINEAWLKKLK